MLNNQSIISEVDFNNKKICQYNDINKNLEIEFIISNTKYIKHSKDIIIKYIRNSPLIIISIIIILNFILIKINDLIINNIDFSGIILILFIQYIMLLLIGLAIVKPPLLFNHYLSLKYENFYDELKLMSQNKLINIQSLIKQDFISHINTLFYYKSHNMKFPIYNLNKAYESYINKYSISKINYLKRKIIKYILLFFVAILLLIITKNIFVFIMIEYIIILIFIINYILENKLNIIESSISII